MMSRVLYWGQKWNLAQKRDFVRNRFNAGVQLVQLGCNPLAVWVVHNPRPLQCIGVTELPKILGKAFIPWNNPSEKQKNRDKMRFRCEEAEKGKKVIKVWVEIFSDLFNFKTSHVHILRVLVQDDTHFPDNIRFSTYLGVSRIRSGRDKEKKESVPESKKSHFQKRKTCFTFGAVLL